jgi:Flp pilus assembly protein TadD
MDDPVITPEVKVAQKKKPETVYFDAPKGKAMESIPTPSLNAKRGKTESIIVVDNAITATSQESGVVAATRALRLGRYDAALDMFNDLYRANPRDARILMGRAVTLQKMGSTTEAIDAYEEVLNVDRDNPEAIVNLMGLIRKQYPARALEKLLQLKASHPDNAGILAQLGIAYADSGNLEDAVKSLSSAARIEPNNPQHYFNLGVIAERMKNRIQAIAYYEKALETDAVYGTGRGIDRDMIYDRLTRLRS